MEIVEGISDLPTSTLVSEMFSSVAILLIFYIVMSIGIMCLTLFSTSGFVNINYCKKHMCVGREDTIFHCSFKLSAKLPVLIFYIEQPCG